MANTYLNTLFAVDQITVTKNGRQQRLPSFVFYTADLYKRYHALNAPRICHNEKGQLVCYNDGTYILHFDKNQFRDIITTDSTLEYREKERMFNIFPIGMPKDSTIRINLLRKSVVITIANRNIDLAGQAPGKLLRVGC